MSHALINMKKPLLAIELDDYTLKILQGRATTKGWSVNKLHIEDVKGKSDDDLIAAVKDKLHKLKIRKTKTVLVIPRSLVTVRYLQLPTTNPAELKNMIDMQATRQIPYTKEEMVYDYHITGFTESGYTNVLLVIAHRDIISRYSRVLENSGITPDSIELDSLAIIELCKFLNLAEEKPTAVLDIDYATTNIVIMQKNVPAFTRAVSIGNMHLSGKTVQTSGKDWLSEWVGEINRSLTVFQREQSLSIEKIVVLGNNNNKIIPLVTGRLSFPVSSADLLSHAEGINKTESLEINGFGVTIASLLGAVKEGVNTFVNLIPDEIKISKIKSAKRQSLLITGLLVAGIIGTLGLTLDKKIKDRKSYMSLLETRLKETGPLAKELEVKKERLALIKKQLTTSGSSLDILRELYNIIPQKTALDLFIYDDVQGVTIKGTSPAMSEVFDLIPKLENSPYFENVINRYARQQKLRGQELTEFHIDCSITAPKEGE